MLNRLISSAEAPEVRVLITVDAYAEVLRLAEYLTTLIVEAAENNGARVNMSHLVLRLEALSAAVHNARPEFIVAGPTCTEDEVQRMIVEAREIVVRACQGAN